MENYSLLREANMADLFIFIVKTVENIRSFVLTSGLLHKMEELAKAQFCAINVQETVFQEEGPTMANINLPQGE